MYVKANRESGGRVNGDGFPGCQWSGRRIPTDEGESRVRDLRIILSSQCARSGAGTIKRRNTKEAPVGDSCLISCNHGGVQNRRNISEPEPAMSEQLRLLEEENSRLKLLVARLRRG